MINNFENLLEKVNGFNDKQKLDLSADEDLSIAVMNLVSIEEHFFFTASKTNNDQYFDLLKEVREMRKVLLKKLIKEYEGEVWCISKHLLAASMRLMEVGAKLMGADKKEEAKELFQKSYDLYSMFWALNLKMIKTDDIKKIDDNALNRHDQEKSNSPALANAATAAGSAMAKPGFMGKLRDLVKKAIDCCIE